MGSKKLERCAGRSPGLTNDDEARLADGQAAPSVQLGLVAKRDGNVIVLARATA
jgi:hypothetical protein